MSVEYLAPLFGPVTALFENLVRRASFIFFSFAGHLMSASQPDGTPTLTNV